MRKGYIQVYTGTSKGKTTAALGLSLRAAGAGHKVLIAQFIKKRKCSEHKALERFGDLITIRQYGTGFLRDERSKKAAAAAARKGLEEAAGAIMSKEYDLVILDEITIAVHHGLIAVDDLLPVLKGKPGPVEVVLTGRYADPKIIEAADLVTEMKEIKHYYDKGVKARVGIEW